jgi:Apea-like HEPN
LKGIKSFFSADIGLKQPSMKNAHLYKIIEEYCKAALTFLSATIKAPEDLPTTETEKFQVTGPGSYSGYYVTTVVWYTLVYTHKESLERLDAYQRAIQAFKQDEYISRHLDTLVGVIGERIRVEADDCLRSLLIELLYDQDRLDFQESKLIRIYERIENYFYTDTLTYRYYCLLQGFDMEAERIEISPGLSIRRTSKEEKEKMLSLFSDSSYRQIQFSYDYTLELILELPKYIGDVSINVSSEGSPSEIVRKRFDEVCSALRLYKCGAVGYSFISRTNISWEPHARISTHRFTTQEHFFGPRYVLSGDEARGFPQFWQWFEKINRKKRIDLALRRFNFGYERKTAEDKLIDYMIGFEALLLNESFELAYKLALRGAALLAQNSGERQQIYVELKAAYSKRSDIVHGNPINETITVGNEIVQFGVFISRVEEHLRRTIKEFLALCQSKKESQVIKSLDEKIIKGFTE